VSTPERISVETAAGPLELAVRAAGSGPPVLLIHGWPTSSFLWRDVLPVIAENNRAIALDLPGFGDSDKPLDTRYTFRFYAEALDGLIDALGIDTFGLAVHDLGGPVGLWWALQKPERIDKLALLNTLVYADVSWAVVAFSIALRLPGVRRALTSARGLELAMQIGVANRAVLTPDVIEGVVRPYRGRDARRALIKSALGLSPRRMAEIGPRLRELSCPVRIIYGERDRILPDVARTMARVAADLPQAEVTALHGCGHFLQEEAPDQVGAMLAAFFAP
jgi:haloalkane dehalogenase